MYYELKKGVDPQDFEMMHPRLAIVMGYFGLFCQDHKLPCKITSLFTEDVKIRKHNTHKEGRAFDASVGGWTNGHIEMLRHYMEQNVGVLGAISAKDGKRRVLVYHNGTAPHLHFQVAPY